jgi:hypothetical protein
MEEAVRKRSVMAPAGCMHAFEHKNNHWFVEAPEGTAIGDLSTNTFWAALAGPLRQRDRIYVEAHDGTWGCDCYVKWAKSNDAKVLVLHKYDLEPKHLDNSAINKDMYHTKYIKGRYWCVIRNADGEVLKDGIKSEQEVVTWLDQYVKVAG